MSSPNVVVLNSGGLDSLVLIAHLIQDRHLHPLSIFVDFGQPTVEREREAAFDIAEHYSTPMYLEKVHLGVWNIAFLRGEKYIPVRNMILFGIAATYCEQQEIPRLAMGVTGRDIDGYPARMLTSDGSKPFIHTLRDAFNQSSHLSLMKDTRLITLTPLTNRTKLQVVQMGKRLKVPFEISHTCNVSRIPCGTCRKCIERDRALTKARVTVGAQTNS